MYCPNCGKKVGQRSRFCGECGHKLEPLSDEDTVALSRGALGQQVHTVNRRQPSVKEKSIWLLPLATAVVMAVALGAYYIYEQFINRQVERERIQAEDLALRGKFDDAERLVNQALSKRPLHKTLQTDLTCIKEGQAVQQKLDEAWGKTRQQQFDQALSLIDQAEKKVSGKQGDYFKYLKQLISDKRVAVNVMQVKQEMNNKNSIEELASLISKLSSYKVTEAQEVIKSIKARIAHLSYNKANELLKEKDFIGALALVRQGLNYDSGNKQLLSFEKTIEQQKKAFEQKEKAILERAQMAAAREDLINNTRAVEILQCDGQVTPDGDFQVKGAVRNAGTRPIYMVEVYYTVYDANGKVMGTDSTYIYPNYLNPRAQGFFDSTYYGLWQGSKVKVDRATWYLD